MVYPASQTSMGRSQPNWAIAQLPGLSPEDCQKLIDIGIHSTLQLVAQTQTPAQQQQLAIQIQVHLQHIKKWAALASLSRIPGVGCDFCGTLLHAGIASPQQLARTSLPRLHHQILKLHVSELQSRETCPTLEDISAWIQQARLLSHRFPQQSST